MLRFAPLFGPGVHTFYTRIFDHRVVPVLMGYDPLRAAPASRRRAGGPRGGPRATSARRARSTWCPRAHPALDRAAPGGQDPRAGAASRSPTRRPTRCGRPGWATRPGGFVDYVRYPFVARRREGAARAGLRRARYSQPGRAATPTWRYRHPRGRAGPRRRPRERPQKVVPLAPRSAAADADARGARASSSVPRSSRAAPRARASEARGPAGGARPPAADAGRAGVTGRTLAALLERPLLLVALGGGGRVRLRPRASRETLLPVFEFLYTSGGGWRRTGIEQRARRRAPASSWPTTRACCPRTAS